MIISSIILLGNLNFLQSEFKKSKLESILKDYRKYKHFVQGQINSAKSKYFKNKCEKIQSPAQVWNLRNELLNAKQKQSSPIHSLISNGAECSDP